MTKVNSQVIEVVVQEFHDVDDGVDLYNGFDGDKVVWRLVVGSMLVLSKMLMLRVHCVKLRLR